MTSRSNATGVPSSRVLHPRKIADVVYRSLESAMAEECSERYEVPVILNRADKKTDKPSWVRLRVERRGMVRMPAEIAVSHVGGNIYDIRCSVDAGPSSHHSYSLPGSSNPQSARAPRLGENLARFLLNELERKVGREQLRRSAIPLPTAFSESVQGDGMSQSGGIDS